MTPEQRTRQQIDQLLQQCGWIVHKRSETNLSAGPGVAIRESLSKTGEADYLLFAGGKALVTVETKPEGYTLTRELGEFLDLLQMADQLLSRGTFV
jgi:type I restriction enzyme R subunit